MNKPQTKADMWSVASLSRMALVCALYVVLTLTFSAFSYSYAQFRIAEMFNYLVIFNKRYIPAVTLGVVISNLMSPLGLVDVVVGSLTTFVVLWLGYHLSKRVKTLVAKMAIVGVLAVFFMFTIALELSILSQIPFWPTYGLVALGEGASMLLGGVVIYWLSQRIDLSK